MSSRNRANRFQARYPVALFTLSGIFALCAPPALPGQYSVSPVILPVPASGEDQEFTTVVRNSGDADLHLRIIVEDYDQSFDGRYRNDRFGEHPNSCAGRLEVLPDALTVPAGGTQPVSIRMRGADDPVACWSLIYIENPAPPSGTLRLSTRIGIKVYGLTADGTYYGDITAADVAESGPDRELRFTVSNPEAWPLIMRGTVQIRDLNGTGHGEVPVNVFSVLPGHDREIRVPLPLELEPGKYLAIPVLEYQQEGFVGAQVTFRVAGS